MNHYGVVYKIENLVNGKIYIGQTICVESRWKKHKNDLNNNKHCNQYLQRSWNKYGADNFSFDVIDFADNAKELSYKENYWISRLDTFHNGYNLTPGLEKIDGYSLSKETREKLRNINLGKKQSKETIEKRRKSMMGREVSLETRKKISEAKKGQKLSEEHKQKLSDAKIGKYKGKKSSCSKPIYCIELRKVFFSLQEAVDDLNINNHGISHISQCCNHKRNSAYGYHWRYATQDEIKLNT